METDVSAEVPETTINQGTQQISSPTTVSSITEEGTEITSSQSAGKIPGKSPLVNPEADPAIIILATIFIFIALLIFVLLFRDKFMRILSRKKGQKKISK